MHREMCKAKLHGVTVTEANLQYVGSITLDADLLEAADIVPYEWVYVANVNTGERFETYAIRGERGSGVVSLNGAAARLGHAGDKLIVMSRAWYTAEELAGFHPRMVFVDEANRVLRMDQTEKAQESFHV